MSSQPGKQTIIICILPNTSRSNGNQAMEMCQLTEYNMRNTFLEKSYTKCVEETIPRPFSKKSKWNLSLNLQSKFLYSLLLLYAKVEGYGNILILIADYLLLPLIRLFFKKKEREIAYLIFCIIFEEKYFSCYILLTK